MLKLAVIVNILLSFFPGVAVDLLGCYFHGHACLRDRYLKDPVTNLKQNSTLQSRDAERIGADRISG